MNTVGIDAHKRLHVAVALDEQGRELCSWRGSNSERGWASFDAWLQGLGVERRVGIEGAWGYGRGLARYLVGRGETVFEVNARWTAAGRQTARKPDKTDELDARAIALHVHREAESLVAVERDDETAVLDLLSIERDAAVVDATRLQNQIHALLLQLDLEYQQGLPAMKSHAGLAVVLGYATTSHDALDQARAAAVRRLAQRLALALAQVDELTDQVRVLTAPRFTPLTRLAPPMWARQQRERSIQGTWSVSANMTRVGWTAAEGPRELLGPGRGPSVLS